MRVKTYYLELESPAALRPSSRRVSGFQIRKVEPACPELNRYLYQGIGFQWHWVDRLPWTLGDWRQWTEREGFQTWVSWFKGAPAGYFELEMQADRNVEIASLGLLSSFIGKGMGGALLQEAVRGAWAMGAKRVWLHTCTLDHPRALDNYVARGFRIFRQESRHAHTLPSIGPP